MRLFFAPLLLLTAVFGLVACATSQESVSMDQPQQATNQQALTAYTGTIVYQTLEGGFFSLITPDSQRFTLRHLPPQYRRDGLVVKITGQVNKDIITFTQFGEVLDVSDVLVLDERNAKPAPQQPRQVKSL
ncbi:hypothetical protein [Alteromonas lipolytica]|uniref:Uncharacterized protein n=1 Tax=Alteromonas lipolytica TaxID=1856405 RepID=A0A1E8FFH0_9ALTE|nr:hypothetical protein [Alteromonas lipolytica]OFI34682.1 hypothetical protein BFC17_13950 [Alteromonas lipolytica]GGF53146.1 hypothetical protein GCM10011338_01590 [Alteromonas lipolytica]